MKKKLLKHFSVIVVYCLAAFAAESRIVNVTEYRFNIFSDITSRQSCEDLGYRSAELSNASCKTVPHPEGGTCYKDCVCHAGFKSEGNICTAKACEDYGYISQDDSIQLCSPKSVKLGNNTTVCYECSGCANGYKQSGGNCTAKTCEDYGYQASTCKADQNNIPHTVDLGNVSGICYSCIDCGGAYRYGCAKSTSVTGGLGTACGGKYTACSCAADHVWDSNTGDCSLIGCPTGQYGVNFGTCPTVETDCTTLGYTSDSCASGGLKCPFGDKYACF